MKNTSLEADGIAETRVENNILNPSTDVFHNNFLDNFIKTECLIKDISILSNQYLLSILAKIIYK